MKKIIKKIWNKIFSSGEGNEDSTIRYGGGYEVKELVDGRWIARKGNKSFSMSGSGCSFKIGGNSYASRCIGTKEKAIEIIEKKMAELGKFK